MGRTKNGLPDTLAETISHAINDLKSCEIEGGYKIDMSYWIKRNVDGTCSVCLAGAVMAQTYKCIDSMNPEPGTLINPSSSNKTVQEEDKFRALDLARAGYVGLAVWRFYRNDEEKIKIAECCPIVHDHHNIPDYNINREGFFSALRSLSQELMEVGL